MAIKMYYSGVSGRGVGKVMGFSKSNVMNWIKKLNKVRISSETNQELLDLSILNKQLSETKKSIDNILKIIEMGYYYRFHKTATRRFRSYSS